MRIIHLSDLHLGRSILEQSLIEDQRYILDEIFDIIIARGVDVVLIAGDIYDKSVPNIDAVKLFNSFLTRLNKKKVKVFVIAGNHDSKERLSFGNELLNQSGIFISGIFNGSLDCVELDDEFGKVLIYMLPFVKPADVRMYYPDVEINSYEDAVKCVIAREKIDIRKRNILMIHQFVTSKGVDVERSDSEIISLGGVDNIDVSLFNDFDYVAMGHIHRGQKLVREEVRYAGSPLKYSFSEVSHKKSVPIVDINEKGNIDIELVELSPIRDMRVIKGKLSNLLDDDVIKLGNRDDYISAIITDDDYIMDAIGKLRSVYRNILKLEYHNKRTDSNTLRIGINNEVTKKREIIDIFDDFYKRQNNISLDKERREIVESVIRECQKQEEE